MRENKTFAPCSRWSPKLPPIQTTVDENNDASKGAQHTKQTNVYGACTPAVDRGRDETSFTLNACGTNLTSARSTKASQSAQDENGHVVKRDARHMRTRQAL